MAYEFIADIDDDGAIIPPKYISDFLRHCVGRKARFTMSWVLKKRTLKQNNYYKGIVLPMAYNFFRDAGIDITIDATDKVLKRKVGFVTEYTLPDGGTEVVERSTTELDAIAMAGFTNDVIGCVAVKYGCYIPLPNEHE